MPDPLDSIDGWLRLEAGYFLGDCFIAMYEGDAMTVSRGSLVAADRTGRSFLPKSTDTVPLTVLQAILKQRGLCIVSEEDVNALAGVREVVEGMDSVRYVTDDMCESYERISDLVRVSRPASVVVVARRL